MKDYASLDDVVDGIARHGLEQVKTQLGKAWDSLTNDERKDCERLLQKIAMAKMLEIGGADVSEYLPILEAALLQWKALASLEFRAALVAAVKEVLSFAGTFTASAVRTLVMGALK